MAILGKVRIDKWLWSIRIFKSRTLSTKNCEQGRVKIDDETVKASYKLVVGQTVVVRVNHMKKTLKVLRLIEKRVGADIAATCYEDISPEEDKIDFSKVKSSVLVPNAYRQKGDGRPTKRDRRDIDKYNDI